MHKKQEQLKELLRSYGSLAVAYSSGVDSTYLLKVAKEVLGEKVIAITAVSSSFPKRETKEAYDFCRENNTKHIMVDTKELEIEGFRDNPKNRCYLCKKEIFGRLIDVAKENGFDTVAEASNMDDNGDYRPGLIAVKELLVESPLRKVGLYKDEIRKLSKEYGLPTWSKPSYACLASRFVYGEFIDEEKLGMVEKGEELLMEMGFKQMRVRIHDRLARIEVEPEEIDRIMLPENRERILKEFKEYGFSYVSLDLQGYRTGSMNETLSEEEIRAGRQC